jgi:hypothetical protein
LKLIKHLFIPRIFDLFWQTGVDSQHGDLPVE